MVCSRRERVGLVWGRGLFFCPLRTALEVTEANTGRLVLCAEMAEGEELILSFVHSVNRRPVYDTLRAEGDHLVIVKSRFDSFGAGMPDGSTQDGRLTTRPDGWLEWTVNRPVPDVTVRIGRVADHKLHIKGREIALSELAEPGSPLSLRIRRVSLYTMVKGRCMP